MTNAEKYLKDGVSVNELCYELSSYCSSIKFNGFTARKLEGFFNRPVKLRLTEDERVILRNLQPEITLIGRTGANELFIAIDSTDEFVDFYCYDHLFQFIKENEEYEIKELLKGE